MRALVVYETVFGATQAVAEAVAGGLAEGMDVDVEVVDVRKAPTELPDDVELLVVGAPAPTLLGQALPWLDRRSVTRERMAQVEDQPTVRDWLRALDVGASRASAVTFDTRDRYQFTVAGALAAERALRRKGLAVLRAPQSFRVVGTTYLPAQGEVDRARRWGHELSTEFEDLGFVCHSA